MSKIVFRTALAFAIMSTVGLTGAMAAKKAEREAEVREIQRQKTGASKEFLCGAEATQKNLRGGTAARRAYIAQCLAR